jgi:serine/threonine protein kinase
MEDRGTSAACPHCGWQETVTPESPHYLAPRTTLQEQYLLGRVLGHGGFAITYLAWDLNLARKLAVKEFLPSGIATRAAGSTSVVTYSGQAKTDFEYGLEKFLEEARVLARFQNHPGIISVLNFFRANGTAYLVMEYLEGTTLKDYLAANGDKIPFDTAVKLMMPVMDALREVHKTAILHRDISPDNIYVTTGGLIKVLDFGAARYALSDRSQNLSVILKTGYAPEEQFRSKGKQGPWTDVYAVGATIYRAITGNIPPPAPDRLDQDEIERPSLLGVSIDGRAENALLKALAVRAPDRYQSMEDFQEALALSPVEEGATRIIKDKEIASPRLESPSPPLAIPRPSTPRKWLWPVGIAAGLVLATIVTLSLRKTGTVEVPKEKPEPVSVAIPNMTGTWQTVINDGFRTRTCVSENAPNGEYRFSSSCPPPLTNERGRGELFANGTWKLQSYTGRSDNGTYRVLSEDQVEMTGQLGTAVWTRVQAATKQASQGAGGAPSRRVRDLPRSQVYSAPSQEDWQRQEAQRRAFADQQRRQQQEALERQRQIQFEQQQQRQKDLQERQAKRQQEQLIQEGAKAIQQLFRR